MKIKKKIWRVAESAENMRKNPIAVEISDELSVSIPIAQLLINRGYPTVEDAEKFLGKREEMFYNPFDLIDMDKTVERILAAIERNEKIVIYGDYDVDGVTSVSILYLYLQEKGANVSYYIPCRNGEGYGMSSQAVQKLADDKIDLIITVDTGITAHEETEFAKSLGIDVVITDHHECRSVLPGAYSIVNPRRLDCGYPFKDLAGVGVVFKLLCALECISRPNAKMADCVRDICVAYADLVAIGTVADVMPIKDENRLIVSYGLKILEEIMRPGIEELVDASSKNTDYKPNIRDTNVKNRPKKKISSGFIGYTIAPRINAAGRISNASIAVELFLTKDRDRAYDLSMQLCEINRKRQIEENKIADEAYAKIMAEHDLENECILVLDDEKWHHGIIGIVASRVTEKFGCPSILISFEGGYEDTVNKEISPDDIGKGSGRSVKGMNLVKALSCCDDLLIKYGGHELAAGLTINRKMLPEFKQRINEHAKKCFHNAEIESTIDVDCELIPADVTMKLATELYGLEPYGVSNPVPVFVMYDMQISEIVPVGGGRHTRIGLKNVNFSVVAIYFSMAASEMNLFPGDYVDVLFNLDINEFQGTKNIQFIVKDIKLSANQERYENRQREISEDVKNGNKVENTDESEIVPTKDDFAVVYNLIKRELRIEHEVFSMRALLYLLKISGSEINYVKLKTIIKVFQELNILGVVEIDDDVYQFKYVYVKTKTSLDRSNIYKKLKCLYR